MRVTLATLLAQSVKEFQTMSAGDEIDPVAYLNWMDRYQAQLIVLSAQVLIFQHIPEHFFHFKGTNNIRIASFFGLDITTQTHLKKTLRLTELLTNHVSSRIH